MGEGGRRRKRRARRRRDAELHLATELGDAKRFLQSPSSDLFERMRAADIFLRHCREDAVTYADLLFFLDTADEAAYMAARALNVKSGRRTEAEIRLADLSISKTFWQQYFRSRGQPTEGSA